MEQWLADAVRLASLIIEAMALVMVAIGSIQCFASGLHLMLTRRGTGHERRDIWLRYSRWLVAALTFQLASDIIATSIAPSWNDIGRLAAIAAIRTALNYFLERDIREARETGPEPEPAAAPSRETTP